MIDWAESRPAAAGIPTAGGVRTRRDDPALGVGWCATANCDQVCCIIPGSACAGDANSWWEKAPPAVSFEEFCRAACSARIKAPRRWAVSGVPHPRP